MRTHTDIADCLDDALGEYRALERHLAEILQSIGITIDAWRVLRLLQRNDGASMKDVLDATALPPASATRAVDTLVSLDYAFRRSGVPDRRSVQVRTTVAGSEALALINSTLNEEFTAPPRGPVDLEILPG